MTKQDTIQAKNILSTHRKCSVLCRMIWLRCNVKRVSLSVLCGFSSFLWWCIAQMLLALHVPTLNFLPAVCGLSIVYLRSIQLDALWCLWFCGSCIVAGRLTGRLAGWLAFFPLCHYSSQLSVHIGSLRFPQHFFAYFLSIFGQWHTQQRPKAVWDILCIITRSFVSAFNFSCCCRFGGGEICYHHH